MQRTSKVQEFNGTFEFFINGSKKMENGTIEIAISNIQIQLRYFRLCFFVVI